jgi:hypothetical protein
MVSAHSLAFVGREALLGASAIGRPAQSGTSAIGHQRAGSEQQPPGKETAATIVTRKLQPGDDRLQIVEAQRGDAGATVRPPQCQKKAAGLRRRLV